jgi:hypothetical protein
MASLTCRLRARTASLAGLALGDFLLLMILIRTANEVAPEPASTALAHQPGSAAGVPAGPPQVPDLEQAILDWHGAGHSQPACWRLSGPGGLAAVQSARANLPGGS